MVSLNLEDRYLSFLESQVQAGLYESISDAAIDAIRLRMLSYEEERQQSILVELARGEASIINEPTITYHENLMSEISEKGKQDAILGKPVRDEVKP